MASSYTRQLWNIAEAYQESGEPWPASARTMVQWARRMKLLAMRDADIDARLADDLARALREQYYLDPQGRNVRTKHCARISINGQQQTLWDDIRTADRGFVVMATQQRRQQIVGDCRQLKTDVDSFNQNNNHGDPIKLVLDFTYDVEENPEA
jgi:hypothetical protein